MTIEDAWAGFTEAIELAVSRIDGDQDPLNEREAADGHQYVLRVLAAVSQSALVHLDPARPAFLSMLDTVRYLGAAGPDIDYDVAAVEPGTRYEVTGARGGATYVGIAVYAHAGEKGASEIVASVDIDDVVDDHGRFRFVVDHPRAARVMIRQYFHDRTTQQRGSWQIAPVDPSATTDASMRSDAPRPTVTSLGARVSAAGQSIRWNAMLNQLWTPARRAEPNQFVRQTADDIVAAVPNPDVTYAFTWWRLGAGESLAIDLTPPAVRYWSIQLCDRWFQCFPDRRSALNDRQIVANADDSVRIVLADGDPGTTNWLDTSGHHTGVVFLRWLHADPAELPTCTVLPAT